MTDGTTWLENLKPGDAVLIDRGRRSDSRRFIEATVERLTATQVVISGWSKRYRRKDGQEITSRDVWVGRDELRNPADPVVAKEKEESDQRDRRDRAVQLIQLSVEHTKIPTEKLEAIVAMLKGESK